MIGVIISDYRYPGMKGIIFINIMIADHLLVITLVNFDPLY